MSTKPFKLQFGGPIPPFEARTSQVPKLPFDGVVGRYVVLCFFGSANDPVVTRLFEELQQRRLFDGHNVAFFGVSIDPEDERSGRVRDALPGFRLFWDFDCKVSRAFGAAGPAEGDAAGQRYHRFSLVLDERLRVVDVVPLTADPMRHVALLVEALEALPSLDAATPPPVAPILIVPRLFEPELCRALIAYYEERGGGESGFMRDVDGMTVGVHDYYHKRRRDEEIIDRSLRQACMVRIHDRLLPEILKSYQFQATRIERYLVACYEAATGGHFRAHRDNTTKGTAHRRFAVSLVLNTGDFEGGGLSFPEFGRRAYSPPAGGAVVFSCSLMHEVSPVTRGKRYAFLPFLYDDAAARIRQENRHFVQSDKL